jgi:putative transposase
LRACRIPPLRSGSFFEAPSVPATPAGKVVTANHFELGAQRVCREHEIAQTTYYKWKQEYGGMQASHIKRLRELEEENRKLKQMYAELSLDHLMLKRCQAQ